MNFADAYIQSIINDNEAESDYDYECRTLRQQDFYRSHHCAWCGERVSNPEEKVYDNGFLFCSWDCWASDVEAERALSRCSFCDLPVEDNAIRTSDGVFCCEACAAGASFLNSCISEE